MKRKPSFISRMSTGERVFEFFNIIFLGLLCALLLYPLIYMISVSVSGYGKADEVFLLPIEIQFNAYKMLTKIPNVLSGYQNTILYVFFGVSTSMILTTMMAYALSKPYLIGRRFFSLFIVITMYFSGGLIPSYIWITNGLQWGNTFWVMIIPGAINTYNLIVMRTYFTSSVPRELEEAAEIDGAGTMRTFWSVYLPLSKPILATITLFYFVAGWNSWMGAWLYLDDPTKYPIQLVLRNAMQQSLTSGLSGGLMAELIQNKIDGTALNYALTVCVILPLLLLVPFLQKFFVRGVTIGSVKG